MMRTSMVVVGTIMLLGIASLGEATSYTSDPNVANFYVSEYATFTNRASLSGDLVGNTPTDATINAGNRVYGNDLTPPIEAAFSAATDSIRVFANMDHLGFPFDGYQYTIYGSTDGSSYTPLFDALTVLGSGEPFTLGTFNGTAPTTVNNVVVGIGGGEGQTGYIADFTFSSAYQYYRCGASTVAYAQGNIDQELSAVGNLAAVPETSTLLLLGLGLVGLAAWQWKRQGTTLA